MARQHEFRPDRLRWIIGMCDDVQASPHISPEDKAFIGEVRRKCERRLEEGLLQQAWARERASAAAPGSFRQLAAVLNARVA